MKDDEFDIEFETDSFVEEQEAMKQKPKGLIGILMRIGIVRTQTAASWMLVIFSLVLLSAAGFIFINELVLDTLPPSQEEREEIRTITPPSS